MAKIKVKAPDSATAMEEVIRRLGVDALIVSTKSVDGQIEMIATDDNQTTDSDWVRTNGSSKSNEFKNFADVLGMKVSEFEHTDKEDQQRIQFDPNAALEKIHKELDAIKSYLSETTLDNDQRNDLFDPFTVVGMSEGIKKQLKSVDLGDNPSEDKISKTLAKSLVMGKNEDFENSDIFFVCGLPRSGKSVFIKKYIEFQKEKHPDLIFKVAPDVKNINDYKNIAKMVSSTKNANQIGSNKVIAEVDDLDQLEANLYRFKLENPTLKFCVINIVEVGKSYDFLVKNIREAKFENEYLVISKLDLCDIGLPEISALIELGHKCLFFSGTPSLKDGLYYSRVEQIAAHIGALINRKKGA
jgi:hypothetical protein